MAAGGQGGLVLVEGVCGRGRGWGAWYRRRFGYWPYDMIVCLHFTKLTHGATISQLTMHDDDGGCSPTWHVIMLMLHKREIQYLDRKNAFQPHTYPHIRYTRSFWFGGIGSTKYQKLARGHRTKRGISSLNNLLFLTKYDIYIIIRIRNVILGNRCRSRKTNIFFWRECSIGPLKRTALLKKKNLFCLFPKDAFESVSCGVY